MTPLVLLFQLCILVFNSDDPSYNCSIDVYILDSQQEVQVWWNEIYAERNDDKKWDGWPIQSFWDSTDRIIVLQKGDLDLLQHEWWHANCWMYYYYNERVNLPWCDERPHWKIQF